MKRGGPLARRTPLKSRTPLKGSSLQGGAGTVPAQRAPIRPRSLKRQAQMEVRRPLVAALLAAHPRCQVRALCNGAPSVDVHERLKRSRGGSITDPRHGHMVTTCRACHDWTEAHPAEATAARMLLPSWHVCPPVGPC